MLIRVVVSSYVPEGEDFTDAGWLTQSIFVVPKSEASVKCRRALWLHFQQTEVTKFKILEATRGPWAFPEYADVAVIDEDGNWAGCNEWQMPAPGAEFDDVPRCSSCGMPGGNHDVAASFNELTER